MNEPATTFYEFGPFRLDVTEQQLWGDSAAVCSEPLKETKS